MNIKKLLLATITTLMLGGIIFYPPPKSRIQSDAAITETKRIWAIARESWWFNDDVSFGVSTATGFNEGNALNYTTYLLQRDENNFDSGETSQYTGSQTYAFYVDVPTNITHVEFFREASPINRFNYSGWSSYTSGMKFVFNGSTTEFSGYTFNETKVVENFASSTNNLFGNCSAETVDSIVNNYNNLSTFEQNQFDVKDFNGVSGLDRLNYLISISGSTSELN